MKTSRALGPEEEEIHGWRKSANSSDSTDLDISCGEPFSITTPKTREPESWCERKSSQREAILFIKLRPDGTTPAHICLSTHVWLGNQLSRFSSSPLFCADPVTMMSKLTGLYSFSVTLSEACGGCWSQSHQAGGRRTVDSPILTANHRISLSLNSWFFWLPPPDPCNKTGFSSA